MTKRRGYLGLLAGGLSMLAGCGAFRRSEPRTEPPSISIPQTQTDEPEPTRQDESPIIPETSFEHVVNMVDDIGVDNSGETPIDDAFNSALKNDTLYVFPEGTYWFDKPHTIANLDRIGIVGRGNVTIKPNDIWNGQLFDIVYVREFLFSGFDVDLTGNDTTVGFRVACEDQFRIEDIELVGRGTHPNEDVYHALNAGLVNRDGQGVIREFVAKKGSVVDGYKSGDGRGGIYIGPWNKGTISIEDCHLEEFGNNGIYASRTPGNVRVSGGIFRNNNPSSIRISGAGSFVENVLIEVDPAKYTGPPFDASNSKLRGLVIEQKTDQEDILKPAGAVIRDSRIIFRENPTWGEPIVVWSNGKTLTIENCEIHVGNNTPAVVREGLEKQGSNPPWEGDRWVRLVETKITGTSFEDTPAVRLIDSPGSEIRNCTIERPENGCVGVELVRSTNALIEGGSMRTGSYPVLIDGGAESDECLISFVGEPTLQMTGTASDAAEVSEQSIVCSAIDGRDAASSHQLSQSCCVTWEDISEVASADGSSIGLAGFDGEDMVFQSL